MKPTCALFGLALLVIGGAAGCAESEPEELVMMGSVESVEIGEVSEEEMAEFEAEQQANADALAAAALPPPDESPPSSGGSSSTRGSRASSSSASGGGNDSAGSARSGGRFGITEDLTLNAPPPSAVSTGRSLSEAEIVRAVSFQRGQVRHCYEQQLVQREDLAGILQLSWQVGGDGSVISGTIRVEQNSTGSRELARCARQKIARWQFPAVGGTTEVAYPFRLSPSRRF